MASPFDSQYASIVQRIYHYADIYGIDRNIAVWQLWQENKFRSTGCSGAGACGIAQFIPATAARFGITDRSDVESSLNGWGQYMQWLLGRSYIHGDYSLALAGYNAGEGNVQKYGGIPPFTETRNYVTTIMRNAGQPAPANSGGLIDIGNVDGGTVYASDDNKLLYYGLGFILLVLLTD